ncbi:MAG: 4-hydroxy-tetrahydrodipicolinate reductase [Christensenellaceae bacterium]|jgi:4-hydroxy-tetrahydrodipicolinate reductase
MIKILLSGVNGRMGQTLRNCIENTEGTEVVCGVDKMPDVIENPFPVYGSLADVQEQADVLIDFSRPDALPELLSYAKKNRTALVLATTGYTEADKKNIFQAAEETPVFFSANMSLGVNMQMSLAKSAADFLGDKYDIEIIEKHHNQKVDSPSGTALFIADHINESFGGRKKYVFGRSPQTPGKRTNDEIGLHAVRGGTVVGEHEVLFLGNDEVITITHSALSKQVFAEGAVRAAQYMHGKPAGLYSMKDMIAESNVVTHLYCRDGEAIVTLRGVPYEPAFIADVFELLGQNEINIDIISQTYPQNDIIDVSFSLEKGDVASVQKLMEDMPNIQYEVADDISRLTIEGIGMAQESGVAAKLFHALATENIKIILLSTSLTKISCCIHTADTGKAISAVTRAFNL